MKCKLIASTILMMTFSVYSAEVPIYKWVDDDGIVHFSHSHPTDKIVSEVIVKVDYTPPPVVSKVDDQALLAEQAEGELKDKVAQSEDNLKLIENNCKSARANKNILSNFQKILIKDENGVEKLLTGEEIKAQQEKNEINIATYCINS